MAKNLSPLSVSKDINPEFNIPVCVFHSDGYLKLNPTSVFVYVFHPAVSSVGSEIEVTVFGVGETD